MRKIDLERLENEREAIEDRTELVEGIKPPSISALQILLQEEAVLLSRLREVNELLNPAVNTMPEITSVRVEPLTGFNNLKALASINYRGVVLRSLKLLENEDGTLSLGMPSRKRGERWEDIYFFSDVTTRERILAVIITVYRKEIAK
jgi:DNA-binding cell septation regulator SpoVG